MNTTFLYCKYAILNLCNSYILPSLKYFSFANYYILASYYFLAKCLSLELAPRESSTNSHRPGVVAREPKRELRRRDYAMMFTKHHRMGETLGMAAGPDSVPFSSKTKRKEEKVFFTSP